MAMHPEAKLIAWDVAYEIWLFDEAVKAYRTALRGLNRFQHNLLMESTLLHARVIWEFLFGGTPKKVRGEERPDVRAFHFFDDRRQWKHDETKLCPFLAANLERLHRSLAHLSYSRATYGKKGNGWDISIVASEIHIAWGCFLSQLPADRRQWIEWASEAQQKDNRGWYLRKVGLG